MLNYVNQKKMIVPYRDEYGFVKEMILFYNENWPDRSDTLSRKMMMMISPIYFQN